MVTFYPIRKLKRGKKDAQLRTFFSKNDYISQDLTVEKVKWLTAASRDVRVMFGTVANNNTTWYI